MIAAACTYILMIADQNLEYLDRTMDSILCQTIGQEKLKVVIIDNASSYEEYKKLVAYEIKYPALVSVIREKEPTTRGRLLKSMIRHLRYSEVGSSIILNPGDIIYPDFIEKARKILNLKRDLCCVIGETEIWNGETIIRQPAIFTDDCILNKSCRYAYYKFGVGHKIQTLFRGCPISLEKKLRYYEVVAKNHDWLSLSYYGSCDCAYLKDLAGCVYENSNFYGKDELIEWSFYLKYSFYAAETQVFSTMKAASIEKKEMELAYHCLAVMGLQYALKNLKSEKFEDAEDAVVFAQMMDSGIVNEERYQKVNQAIEAGKYTNELEALLEGESAAPPRESITF